MGFLLQDSSSIAKWLQHNFNPNGLMIYKLPSCDILYSNAGLPLCGDRDKLFPTYSLIYMLPFCYLWHLLFIYIMSGGNVQPPTFSCTKWLLTEFLVAAWYLFRGEDEKQVVAPDECLKIRFKKNIT